MHKVIYMFHLFQKVCFNNTILENLRSVFVKIDLPVGIVAMIHNNTQLPRIYVADMGLHRDENIN